MLFKQYSPKSGILFIIFFIILHSVQPYVVFDHEIRDLEKNIEDSFIEDASAWTISQFDDPQRPIKYNRCGDTFMLGGPGVLGSYFFSHKKYGQSGKYYERVYNDVPKHQSIRLSFRFWAIGNWSDEDSVELHIDDQAVKIWYLNEHAHSQASACEEHDNGLEEYRLHLAINHAGAGSLRLKFVSQINKLSKDGSFGLRDIHLLFGGILIPDTSSNAYLGSSPIALHDSISYCPIDKYQISDIYCFPCDPSCKACFGWYNEGNYCYRCQSGHYFNGLTCKKLCSNNCGVCSGPNDCKECNLGYMLVENKCLLPCALLNDYRYDNGSCINQCSSSSVTRTIGTAKFCFEVSVKEESGVNLGLIVGSSTGGVIVLLSISIYCYIRRRKMKKKEKREDKLVQNDQMQRAQNQNENEADVRGVAAEIIERPLDIKDEMLIMKMPGDLEGADPEPHELK